MKKEKEVNGEKYIAYNLPDKELLSELFLKAQGKRTGEEWAGILGISPAQVTIIKKGSYKKALSVDLIRKVADNSEDKAVTVEDLLTADGYVKKREYLHHQSARHVAENIQREAEVKAIINKELFQRGVGLKKIKNTDIMADIIPCAAWDTDSIKGSRLSCHVDMAIEVDDTDTRYEWLFEICLYGDESEHFLKNKAVFYLHRRLGILLADAWRKDTGNLKISFVFINEALFNDFNNIISKLPIRGKMSTILVNLDSRVVVKEHFVPNAKADKKSLFEKEVIKEEGAEYRDKEYEEY